MLRNWIKQTMSALKAMPRALGCKGNPSILACRKNGSGSTLDMWNKRPGQLVGQALVAGGEHERIGRRHRKVAVEQQHVAVLRGQRLQGVGIGNRIAVLRFAVGDVDDDRRKAPRMLADPLGQDLVGQVEHVAHRRAPFRPRIDPHRHLAGHLEDLAGLFVGQVLHAGVDAGRRGADLGDRNQHPAGQRALQGRLDDRVGLWSVR